jgi:hypothetical protein
MQYKLVFLATQMQTPLVKTFKLSLVTVTLAPWSLRQNTEKIQFVDDPTRDSGRESFLKVKD